MKTFGIKHVLLATMVAAAAAAVESDRVSAATLTVCPSGCAFSQISAAVAAAGSGDTVSVGPGSYPGGFAITKNLSLVGAGAGRTTIDGGGPVITVGTFGGASEPTVSISGVTVTGGSTSSSDQSNVFFGDPNVWAIGGGIYVPFAANFTPGATVTISDSAISGNQVSPTSSAPIGPASPAACRARSPRPPAAGSATRAPSRLWGRRSPTIKPAAARRAMQTAPGSGSPEVAL